MPIDAFPDVRNTVVTDVSDKVLRIDLIVPCATGVLVPLTVGIINFDVNIKIEVRMILVVVTVIA